MAAREEKKAGKSDTMPNFPNFLTQQDNTQSSANNEKEITTIAYVIKSHDGLFAQSDLLSLAKWTKCPNVKGTKRADDKHTISTFH